MNKIVGTNFLISINSNRWIAFGYVLWPLLKSQIKCFLFKNLCLDLKFRC